MYVHKLIAKACRERGCIFKAELNCTPAETRILHARQVALGEIEVHILSPEPDGTALDLHLYVEAVIGGRPLTYLDASDFLCADGGAMIFASIRK